LNFCVKTAVPIIGVVENMAGYMCPCYNEITDVFSRGGGKVMAGEYHVPFMGSVPIDTTFGTLKEGGEGELVENSRSCGMCPIFAGFAKTVVQAAILGVNGSTPAAESTNGLS